MRVCTHVFLCDVLFVCVFVARFFFLCLRMCEVNCFLCLSVPPFVCECVSVFTRTHARVCVCLYVYLYLQVNMWMDVGYCGLHAHVGLRECVRLCSCVCTYVRFYVCMCARVVLCYVVLCWVAFVCVG